VKAKNHAGSKAERPFRVPYAGSNHLHRQVELADSIFSLAASPLFGISDKLKLFGNAMPFSRHVGVLLGIGFKLLVSFSNHFARNSIVLYVRVAVDETLTLLTQLSGRHLYFARPFHEFF
jgi:hypothetical protein